MGHENAGIITEVGEGMDHWRVGDRVGLAPVMSDGDALGYGKWDGGFGPRLMATDVRGGDATPVGCKLAKRSGPCLAMRKRISLCTSESLVKGMTDGYRCGGSSDGTASRGHKSNRTGASLECFAINGEPHRKR
jgi:hypothetical protein